MKEISFKRITAHNFRPYGKIIEYPGKQRIGNKRNLWKIILTEPKGYGWRIAYLVLRDKAIRHLEKHPSTFESLEPVRGRSVLFVTSKRDIRLVECFFLDTPVILKKNIWHGLVTLSPETEIKITENAKVKCVYWPLGFKLSTDFSLPRKRNGKRFVRYCPGG